MYSKRWYLTHLLGGKCRECNEENFGKLEIHHRYEDGDLERTYYTKQEQRYLNNPKRAKDRLEILCKTCHEKTHHPKIKTPEPKYEKMHVFMDCLKYLEGENRFPVPEMSLIKMLSLTGFFGHDEGRNYIRRMLREASIYESKPLHYNRV